MAYATAGRRPTAKFPIFGRQWHNLSRGNADLDTASGKDRQKYRREYEGKERYNFGNQRSLSKRLKGV